METKQILVPTAPTPSTLIPPAEPAHRDAAKRLRTGIRAGKNVVWAI